MEKSHDIFWTLNAARDFENIISYISSQNPANAKKIYLSIKDKVLKLSKHPQSGRIVPELQKFNIVRYHEIVFSPWRIIYIIDTGTVYVLTVIDSRRNIEDLLFEKLLKMEY